MDNLLANAITLARTAVGKVLQPGDAAVDATAGNGHDTLFLARMVGPHGRIYAFDLQEQALANTTCRLQAAGELAQVRLFQTGHEEMPVYVGEMVKAAMFNLGYLPGGDHRLVTRPETTIAALRAALELLHPGGVVTVVIYQGHPGGSEEGQAVRAMAAQLPQDKWDVLQVDYPNRVHDSPYLIIFHRHRRPGGREER
ncbi:MAG: tRNA (mnm(5)s(2)U34)-methyltransferase [Bacillota bacterium]